MHRLAPDGAAGRPSLDLNLVAKLGAALSLSLQLRGRIGTREGKPGFSAL